MFHTFCTMLHLEFILLGWISQSLLHQAYFRRVQLLKVETVFERDFDPLFLVILNLYIDMSLLYNHK